MVKSIQTARNAMFWLLIAELATCGGPASAGDNLSPYHAGCVSIPNAQFFGHFETKWRRWPGKGQKDVAFPQSMNAEEIPRPEGQQRKAVPRIQAPGGSILPSLEGAPFGEVAPPTAEPAAPSLQPSDALAPPTAPVLPPSFDPQPVEPPPIPSSDPGEPSSSPATPTLESPAPTLEPAPEEPSLPQSFNATGRSHLAAQMVPKESNSNAGQKSGTETALPEPEPKPFATERQPLLIAPRQDDAQTTTEPPSMTEPIADAASGVRSAPQTAVTPSGPPQAPKAKPLQANWMAALHPGFQGDAGRTSAKYPSSPTRQVAHETAVASTRPTGGQTAKRQSVDSPPVALDGFCPVELLQNEQWVSGDPSMTAVYRGRTYMFAGSDQRKQFKADPVRHTPRFSGHDPVLVVDGRRRVLGKTDYCVTYEGRLYMFSSSVTLSRFRQNPTRYAGQADR